MILDFASMPLTVLENFKGGEKHVESKMHVDEFGRIMCGTLIPGASIGLHVHEDSSEMLYCLSGSAKAIYDGVEERITAGTCHYCPKGHSHTVINDTDEDMTFFTVVPQQ